ncbi:MAG: hypothetical protein NXI31_08270 [bacterium]|nr:hypothetical protein [bacterium]
MTSQVALRTVGLLATLFPLTAQTALVPAAMAGVEGGSASNVPFGSSLACRYQVIYDAEELSWTGPRLIQGLRFRADSPGATSPMIPAKGFLVVTIRMSTTAVSSASASSIFDDNYGEDVLTVLTALPVQLPMQPASGAGPRPANVLFTFANPWWFGLTPARPNQPPPDNLLIEIQILSQPSGSYPLDNLGGCVAATTTFGNQGPACTVPALSAPPALDSDRSMTAGQSFSWRLMDAPANAPFVLAFNVTAQGGLFGNPLYPLPYPMFDPQNPSQPSAALATLQWPAPDCWLNIDPAVTLFGLCDASGNGVVPTQIPPGRGNVGFELFAQALILSQTSNPLQVITTRGRSSTVCGPLGVTRIFAFYDGSGTPAPPPPTAGAVQYGLGPVIEVF